MSIRTVYEYTDSDKGFYSVERAGFVTVSEMIFRLVADVQNNGFTVINTKFVNDTLTSSSGASISVTDYTQVWPPSIREFKMINAGTGYSVGDRLGLLGGSYDTPFLINVTAVGSAISEITKYQYNVPATYNSIVGLAQPQQLVFCEIDGSANVDASRGSFYINSPVTNSKGGTAVANLLARSSGIPSDEVPETNWNIAWGVNGSGGTKGSTWPAGTDKIWYFNSTSGTRVGSTGTIKKGQEIFDSAGVSTIPAGTTIKNFGTFSIPISTFLNSTTFRYVDSTTTATWLELSNNVTIAANTTINVRGTGARFTSNTSKPPKKFTVALEASAQVDPKNDPVGVFANVASSITNSNQLQVDTLTNLQPAGKWKPVIYAGQRVFDPIQPPGVPAFSNYVTVVGANVNSTYTQANLTLSSNLTLSAGLQLQFKFDESEAWRIAIDVSDPEVVTFYAATDIQINDSANISYVRDNSGSIIDRSGALGAAPTGSPDGTPDPTKVTEGFLNRKTRVVTDGNAYPLNYSLTISNRGIFFGSWEGSFSVLQRTSRLSDDNFFNWFLIQRPVDRYTGKTLTTGKSPVFCVNCVGYRYWQFVVRETDVLHPSQGDADSRRLYANPVTNALVNEVSPYRVPADAHWKDSFAIINSSNQISLTEDSKYLVSFLYNLTTPRFRYSEELDMLGQSSADVCMASNEISVTAYRESTQRIYKALPANNIYNSGLRICVLKKL